MLTIFKRVLSAYKEHYSNESDEFKRGAKTIIGLFKVGIYKSFQFNLAIKSNEQEKKIKELEKINFNLKKEIKSLKEKLQSNSLLNIQPSEIYTSFKVDTKDGDSFEIITNMSKDSFEFCLLNFSFRHSFNRVDECKSKLLTFINGRHAQGFRAFKDKKSYNKFINGKL